VAFVVFAPALTGLTERLAGVSSDESVECSGKWSGVECGDIIPDWGCGEISGALGVDEDFAGIFLPLDKTTGVELWLCEHEAHIKAAATGAQRQSVSGR
jgi:hypothetical protein